MSLGSQARTFREVFNQQVLSNFSAYGHINSDLWNMQIDLIREESAEFIEAADECFADPENPDRRTDLAKDCLILSLFVISLPLLSALI